MGLFGKKKTEENAEKKQGAAAGVDIREALLDSLAGICEDDVVKEDPDINIVEEGLIDSLGFIELLMQIEEKTGVVIAPTEYTREEMSTPNKIIAIVEAKAADEA